MYVFQRPFAGACAPNFGKQWTLQSPHLRFFCFPLILGITFVRDKGWSRTTQSSRLSSPLGHTPAEANTCCHFPSTSPWPTCISVAFCFPADQTLQPSFCSYQMESGRPRLDPWECGEWQRSIRCRRTCRRWSTCASQPVRFAEHFVASHILWHHIFRILQTPRVLGTPWHNWTFEPPRRFHCPAFSLRGQTPWALLRLIVEPSGAAWRSTGKQHRRHTACHLARAPMSWPWWRWYDVTVEQCDGRTLLGCPTPAFFVPRIIRAIPDTLAGLGEEQEASQLHPRTPSTRCPCCISTVLTSADTLVSVWRC